MAEIAVEIRNLSKKMKQNQALKNVDLDFAAGVMHGVIGPEGAGKTTLLRILMGLLHQDEGEVTYLDGTNSIAFEDLRPTMAYMPQAQSLYPDLSVNEHLLFFKSLYNLDDSTYQRRSERLLEITRLKEFTDRQTSKLSGGMYKKLGLICSLLHSPRVLLLDEPTNGVDPISRRDFWDLLYQLEEEGILILVTTSYMDEAERCKEVHLLLEGEVLQQGEPKEVLEREGCANFDQLFLKLRGST
ncbi:putative ABC transporter ATP-binding protein YbhF [compost metagenome]